MAARKASSRRKYGKAASKSVESAMRRRKSGTLKSGAGNHPKVKSREQAIAIGLSEARAKGAKVPRKRSSAKKASAKRSTAKRSTVKRATTRKASAKKSTSRRKSATKRSSSKRGR